MLSIITGQRADWWKRPIKSGKNFRVLSRVPRPQHYHVGADNMVESYIGPGVITIPIGKPYYVTIMILSPVFLGGGFGTEAESRITRNGAILRNCFYLVAGAEVPACL